jgi:very-short-patch-repair endonuclease
MRAEQALERLGGVADTAALLVLTNRRAIRIALRRGAIVRDNRGRYSLPGVDEAIRAANRLDGVLTEDSAAQYYGWELKHPPPSPCIAVPRNRKLTAARRQGVRVRYVDVHAGDVNGIATSPGATVMACAARMPFDEALAVADSALRHRDVTKAELLKRAEAKPARYRARCLRVAELATDKAANPFESVTRAIAEDVRGLHVEAQVWVDGIGRPDLVDRVLRLVIEADSFEFHGNRKALKSDCERYNAFVVAGWLVLRFTYEHVMFEPQYVRQVLLAVVELLSRGPLGRALDQVAERRTA